MTLKRILDLGLTIPSIIILLPLIMLIALLVLIKLGPPVFFRQQRPGLKAKPFTLLKFRTMTHKRDMSGKLLSDAERLTSFGRILRNLSLDELPEFINVIKGEMSFVGPRPLLMQYLTCYTQEQARRHNVKPGITGWAQINGRNAISWEEKFKMDLWYVDNQSLLFDLKIIFLTIWKIITREGINQVGYATTEFFYDEK